MGRACATHGRGGGEKYIEGYGREAWENHLEDLSVHGRMIMQWILNK
jgi:hypothetical protein